MNERVPKSCGWKSTGTRLHFFPHDITVLGLRRGEKLDQRQCAITQAYMLFHLLRLPSDVHFGVLHRAAFESMLEALERGGNIVRQYRTGHSTAMAHHFKQPLRNIAEHGKVGIRIAFKFYQHILVCWQGYL